MEHDNKIARIVGALILIALIGNFIGSELLDSLITATDFLINAGPQKAKIVLGMLLELASAIAVVGIPVLMYPILKQYNRNMALGYFAFRIIEPAITISILLNSLALLTLSQQFLAAGSPQAGYFDTLGTIFQTERYWALMMYIVIFSAGAVLFYTLLYKSRLVPRFISIWAFAGIALLLGGAVFDMFGGGIPVEAYGAVMGLNELFLGIWLLARGFSAPEMVRA
ncbi:MAG: DUF4386 domain-containing protein [Paracoccaceae bacterium]